MTKKEFDKKEIEKNWSTLDAVFKTLKSLSDIGNNNSDIGFSLADNYHLNGKVSYLLDLFYQKQNGKGHADMYMNPSTGSVDTLEGWYPHTPKKSNLIQVVWDKDEQTWIEQTT
jgi:hypothetical protein